MGRMNRHVRTAVIAVVLFFALVGVVFSAVFLAMQFGLLNVRGSIAERNSFFFGNATSTIPTKPCDDAAVTVCDWNQTPEWDVVRGGLTKDQALIARVSAETGVSERMIASIVVPEQTRFFTDNREVFKRYFEPLKILGSLSQFSLGVSGIKEKTANDIEDFAASTTSAFYPGPGITQLLAYPENSDHGAVLYDRLTDAKDHYYSLLYTAVFIKEIQAQWRAAGFDISNNAAIIATLFNIGFQGSHPNANPKTAGAPITTGGHTYAYGELAGLFYHSMELSDVFKN